MDAPNCHKTSFEAGVVTLARQAAAKLSGALSTNEPRRSDR